MSKQTLKKKVAELERVVAQLCQDAGTGRQLEPTEQRD